MTAVINDIIVIAEHAIGWPIVAHESPDIFHHVQLRTFWQQRQQGDDDWRLYLTRNVPSSLIEEWHRMLAGADHAADFSSSARCALRPRTRPLMR